MYITTKILSTIRSTTTSKLFFYSIIFYLVKQQVSKIITFYVLKVVNTYSWCERCPSTNRAQTFISFRIIYFFFYISLAHKNYSRSEIYNAFIFQLLRCYNLKKKLDLYEYLQLINFFNIFKVVYNCKKIYVAYAIKSC